jgi:uncharacterized protein YjbJ (UPF0337 family)
MSFNNQVFTQVIYILHSHNPVARGRRSSAPSYGDTPMNKNQIEGRADEVKGKVKEVTGKAIGDKSLENKGKAQNLRGKVETAYGDAKQDIKKAVKS